MLAVLLCTVTFTSCMTIFSNSRQTVTFTGEKGIKIYDATNNVKLSEINEEGVTVVKLKKKLSDKTMVAKKEGCKSTPFVVESQFNPKALWNILFWPGFLIDLGTGKINKYEPIVYNIEMEKE